MHLALGHSPPQGTWLLQHMLNSSAQWPASRCTQQIPPAPTLGRFWSTVTRAPAGIATSLELSSTRTLNHLQQPDALSFPPWSSSAWRAGASGELSPGTAFPVAWRVDSQLLSPVQHHTEFSALQWAKAVPSAARPGSLTWDWWLLLIPAIPSFLRVPVLRYSKARLSLITLYIKLSLFKLLCGFSLPAGPRLIHPQHPAPSPQALPRLCCCGF